MPLEKQLANLTYAISLNPVVIKSSLGKMVCNCNTKDSPGKSILRLHVKLIGVVKYRYAGIMIIPKMWIVGRVHFTC